MLTVLSLKFGINPSSESLVSRRQIEIYPSESAVARSSEVARRPDLGPGLDLPCPRTPSHCWTTTKLAGRLAGRSAGFATLPVQ